MTGRGWTYTTAGGRGGTYTNAGGGAYTTGGGATTTGRWTTTGAGRPKRCRGRPSRPAQLVEDGKRPKPQRRIGGSPRPGGRGRRHERRAADEHCREQFFHGSLPFLPALRF